MSTSELSQMSTFVWSRERELVPVYERLLALGSTTDCLELIQELCSIHREKMSDCTALLAAVGVDPPGDFMSLDTDGDLNTLLPLIWTKENQALDEGWLRIDPILTDEGARAILIRASRRHSRQLQLLREIARRCNITLIIVTGPVISPAPIPVPVPMPPHPGPVQGVVEYIVQPGDTMWLISQRFGVSLDTLIRANPQITNPEMIFPGEIVRIPSGGMMPGPAPMPPGPHPGGMGGRRYIVREGDTIEIIAVRFGLNVSELTAFNPDLRPPFRLTPGQVIMIPSSGAVG
ncbi:MAG: SafA/ExsA family spore coat assembly protein [Bacillota bacterium]